MLSVTRFTLDMRKEESQLSFSLKQGDTARRIIATLLDNQEMFYLPDDCYAVFAANKSDGTKFNDSCVIQGGRIIYDLDPQLTLAVGRADCDITVYDRDGGVISTSRFIMVVFESIFAGASDEMVSSDSFHVLNNLIGDANDRIHDMEELNESVTAAEAGRVEAETERVDNEQTREENEAARQANEVERQANESERKASEETRKTNESEREKNEAVRIANEQNRIAAEDLRASAESVRIAAEAARVTAEAARAAAEAARVDRDTGIVAQATVAADRAEASANTSSDAADAAVAKADEAVASATEANSNAALSESWAVGGTGTRVGEDTNNAKYWSEQAEQIAGGNFAPRIHTHQAEDITCSDGVTVETKLTEISVQIGDISFALDTINGEVI